MYINIGIIGNPLGHTFSPTIHTQFLTQASFNGGYASFEAGDKSDLTFLIQTLKKYHFRGINVTLPYKLDIMEFCDKLDNSAKQVGAVNTLLFDNNSIVGYNTDIYGFSRMLEEDSINTFSKKVLIIGAGGAARSVIAHLNIFMPDNLTIANRTLQNAESLASFYDGKADVISLEALKGAEFDIIINTTSQGLKDGKFADYGLYCLEAAIDLQYQSDITPFLSLYKDKNIKLINGFKMLVYQAYRSFVIWTEADFKPDIDLLYKKFCL